MRVDGVRRVRHATPIEFDRGLLSAPPVTLGHEFAGVVEAVGEGVDAPPVGARVVCGAGIACG